MSKQQVSIFMGGTGANTASDARTNLGVVARSGDTMTGNLNVAATLITQNVIPDANITYDLGSSEARFKDLWLSNSTIYLGEASISAQGGNVSFGNAEIQLSNVTTKLNVTNDLFVSGNVGIGTANPAVKLDVVGAISTTGAINSGGIIETFTTVQSSSDADLSLNANGANRDVFLKVNNSTLITIQGSTGNMGIGTTTPACKLDVVSTDAIKIPEGNTAQRPTASTGMIRFNSSLRIFEGYSSLGKWEAMPTAQAHIFNWNISTISSTSNTTFRDMTTFTYTARGPKIISVGITAYNNSGAYYWVWRLYNSTKSAAVSLLDSSTLPGNDVSNGGGIEFRGGVHNAAAQPYVNFDMSGVDDGDTIAIQMSNHTTGQGSVGGLVASSQQLNLDKYVAFHGIVTGLSGTAYWGA